MSDRTRENFEEPYRATQYLLDCFLSEIDAELPSSEEPEIQELKEGVEELQEKLTDLWANFCERRGG